MDDNEEVVPAEEVTEPIEPVEPIEPAEEDTTDYKALAEKNAKAFEDQKKRAEKAEKALKGKPNSGDDLSSKDILALSTSGISDEEDIDILQKAAKINGTTIAQAIKDPIVAGILKGKQEERQSAAAASTGNTRRITSERKGTDLLRTAKADNMPASGTDTRKFVRASLGLPE